MADRIDATPGPGATGGKATPRSGSNRAYLSLGSNIEPARNLPTAVAQLVEHGRIAAVSHVWESPPVGFTEQANFLNAAVLLETSLSPEAIVNEMIPSVERELLRTRDPHNKNAPRTIDVDLSLFNREVLTVCGKPIPDPSILTRAFVAIPLAELDPEYIHPTAKRPLGEIAALLRATTILAPRKDVILRSV